jgi:hypothetical protein
MYKRLAISTIVAAAAIASSAAPGAAQSQPAASAPKSHAVSVAAAGQQRGGCSKKHALCRCPLPPRRPTTSHATESRELGSPRLMCRVPLRAATFDSDHAGA